MTDKPDDSELGRQLKAQERLYNAALESDVTVAGCGWIAKALVLSDIAGDDIEAAKQVIHKPEGLDAALREFEQMTEEQRNDVRSFVGEHWGRCLSASVQKLWHACGALEIDADELNPDYVALHAATLLSRDDMVPK